MENMDPRRVMEELIILRNRLLVDAPAQAPEGGWREAEVWPGCLLGGGCLALGGEGQVRQAWPSQGVGC